MNRIDMARQLNVVSACEDLDPVLIAAASVNISGGGGSQYISNVHLQPYTSTDEFTERLYPHYRHSLLEPAKAFLHKTNAQVDTTLVIVSAGFDASEHEYATMSRHGAKVPTCFFEMFAHDITTFANEHARGRVCAVLEGGYSQRALSTGVASFSELVHSLRRFRLTSKCSDWLCGSFGVLADDARMV